jgi:DNA-binding transcriptional MerR regulator/methylmalonyl-CoA mutase cobalamin-binding subunit
VRAKRSPAGGPRHRIGAVARLTGLSVHTLRVWERRYRTLEPARTDGGTRLYSDADVARLRAIKAVVDGGYAVGDVARLSAQELARAARAQSRGDAGPGPAGGAAAEVRRRFLDAVEALDTERASAVLSGAALAFSPRVFVLSVVAPVLVEVGERWARDAWCVGQEHAASALVRNCLGALLLAQPSDRPRDVAVCAALADERHEFGALLVALLARARGWQAVYLGAAVPAGEIATVARLSGAKLVLASVVAVPRDEAEREIEALARAVPAGVRILVGGRGVSPDMKLPRRVEHVPHVEELSL